MEAAGKKNHFDSASYSKRNEEHPSVVNLCGQSYKQFTKVGFAYYANWLKIQVGGIKWSKLQTGSQLGKELEEK